MLSLALIVILSIFVLMIIRMQNQQNETSAEYVKLHAQTQVNYLVDQFKEFGVITAQLSQNELIQKFLSATNTFERYQYSKFVDDLLRMLLSNSSHVTDVNFYWLNGVRFSISDTDYHLSQAITHNYNVADPENNETSFMLIKTDDTLRYNQFAYIAPVTASTGT